VLCGLSGGTGGSAIHGFSDLQITDRRGFGENLSHDRAGQDQRRPPADEKYQITSHANFTPQINDGLTDTFAFVSLFETENTTIPLTDKH
jgi:hypothetical protein